MSDSVQPHRRQPTRLHHPWDSPGKNTGVGCHFLLQCLKMKSESEIAQSYLTLSDPMDCGLPGSSVHVIFQARVLEWGAIAFSGKQSQSHYYLKIEQTHSWAYIQRNSNSRRHMHPDIHCNIIYKQPRHGCNVSVHQQ